MKAIALSTVALFTATGCGGCGNDNNNNVDNNSSANNTQNNTACEDGEVGCACLDDGSCGAGAACQNDVCVGATVSGLVVSSDDARSCEIMLTEREGSQVIGATYGEQVKGAYRRQAPSVALAVSHTSDEAFPQPLATIQVNGSKSGVEIKSVRCFDKAGELLDGAEASFK